MKPHASVDSPQRAAYPARSLVRPATPVASLLLMLAAASATVGAEPAASPPDSPEAHALHASTATEPDTARYEALFAKLKKLLEYGDNAGFAGPGKLDAITGLALLDDDRALPILLDRLENDQSPHVRFQIAKVLGWSRSPQSVPALEKALRDSYPLVRKQAAMALKTITGRDYEYDRSGLPDLMKFIEAQKNAAKSTP